MSFVAKLQGPYRLSGAQKSAIVFLCLGEDHGGALMQKLDSGEIRKITKAITDMGEIPSDLVDEVMCEFEQKAENFSGVVGSAETARKMLSQFLPEDRVKTILDEIEGEKTGDLWKDISALEPKVLAQYLLQERNQTVAVILTKLAPDVVAHILSFFDQQRTVDIVERMAKISDMPDEALKDLETGLRQEFLSGDRVDIESEIEKHLVKGFNKLDTEVVRGISEVLEKKIPEKIRSIKAQMFVFDDMTKLAANVLALITREAGRKTLPLALRGAQKETRQHFLNSLPQRARDMLVEEMKAMGPVKSRDVKEAQAELVEITMRLAAAGQIELPSDDDEEDIIE